MEKKMTKICRIRNVPRPDRNIAVFIVWRQRVYDVCAPSQKEASACRIGWTTNFSSDFFAPGALT